MFHQCADCTFNKNMDKDNMGYEVHSDFIRIITRTLQNLHITLEHCPVILWNSAHFMLGIPIFQKKIFIMKHKFKKKNMTIFSPVSYTDSWTIHI